MAKLYFVYGAMGASKSAQLLMKAYSFQERGIPFVCMKPSTDTRDGVNVIKSRVGIDRECYVINRLDNIYGIVKDLKTMYIDEPMWLLVDESQFLSKTQVEALARVVDELDVNVMCYGLRTDFKTNLFEGSKRLIELADTIEEIKITCACGRKAVINARIDSNGNIVDNGKQIVLGGDDRYVSMCRKCWFEKTGRSCEEIM